MYKTSVVLLWLVLGAVIPSILASSSSAWTVSTGSTACSGAFTVSNVAYTCDDTQQCGFGSTVKITGYLMAKTTLPESAHITAQGCIYSMFCKTVLDQSDVDLCDGDVLKAQNGQTCPSSGLYKISTSFDLPSNANAASMLSGKTVTVHATIVDDTNGSSTTCSFQAKASSGYQLSWGSMAAGGLVLLAVGAYGIRRRRKSMAQIDLNAGDDEDQLPTSDFELMNNNSRMPHVAMA